MSDAHRLAAESPPAAGAALFPNGIDSRSGDEAQQGQPRPPAAATSLGPRHSPWIAGILAGFPGLGSIYNGSYARGVAFFLTVVGTMHLAERGQGLWGFGVAFVWLFNMIDAYREARILQAGLAQDLGIARRRPATSAAEGLGLGIVLLLIGLVSFLDLSLGIDVDWIYELWPLGLMVAGGWFVVAAIRRARAERVSGASAEPPPHPPQDW